MAQDRMIRDNKGIRGYIREQSQDKYLYGSRPPQVGLIGRYSATTDTTYDINGRIVGYGDQLMTLLHN